MLAIPSAPESPVIVDLKPRADVTGAVYRLGDLAVVSGGTAARAAKLRATVIARSPAPDRIIRITQSGLRNILEARRVGPIRVQGARSISIRARLTYFSPDLIRDAARAFLEVKLRGIPGREVSFVETTPPVRAMAVPAGSEDTRLDSSFTDLPRSRGEVRITVRAVADGMPLDARVVRFLVHARESVLVLTKDVRVGEAITADCVTTKVVDVTKATTDLLRNPSEVRRAVARRVLAAGTPLRESMLRRLPDVRRGDMVEILYRCGSLVVSARRPARSGGRKGTGVTPGGSASGRTVTGRVAGPGLIEVGPVERGGAR